MKPPTTLTPQELAIMKVIWRLEKATVRDVYETLRTKREIAYTTVMTMMRILEEKGYLEKTRLDRAYEYRPTRPRQQVLGAMSPYFLNLVFDTAAPPLLVHLARDSRLSRAEREKIRRLAEEIDE
jgi:BlaI family transcriptional regulator, penicillinase repressor